MRRTWSASRKSFMSTEDSHDTNAAAELAVPPADPPRRWQNLALVLVVLMAGALRFADITSAGIRFDDEVAYTVDARMWHRLARTLFDREAVCAVLDGERDVFARRLEAHGVDFNQRYAKPCQGYTFLAAAMMLLFGEGPEALLVLNALCGTLSVLVLFLLSRRAFGRNTALLAALILAVSPYHLLYCRGALAESSATLFILIGVWLWITGRSGRRARVWVYLLSGTALGYACTCHYKSAVILLIVLVCEVLLWTARRPKRIALAPRLKRFWSVAVLMVVGFVLPIAAIEVLFRALRMMTQAGGIPLPLATFIEAGVYWAGVVREVTAYLGTSGFPQPAVPPLLLAGHFLHWHGLAAGVLTLVGLVVTLRAHGTARVPAIIVLGVLLLYAFQPYALARMNAPLLPFLSLCLAVGIGCTVRALKAQRALVPVAAVLLVALLVPPTVSRSLELYGKPDHLENACLFLARQDPNLVAVPRGATRYELYLEGATAKLIELDGARAVRSHTPPAQVIEELCAQGVRWVVTDPYCWYRPVGNAVLDWWLAFDQELRRTTPPAATFTHLADRRWAFLAEIGLLDSLPEMNRTNAGAIHIYDLQNTMPPVEWKIAQEGQ
jgi:hypothetical protein